VKFLQLNVRWRGLQICVLCAILSVNYKSSVLFSLEVREEFRLNSCTGVTEGEYILSSEEIMRRWQRRGLSAGGAFSGESHRSSTTAMCDQSIPESWRLPHLSPSSGMHSLSPGTVVDSEGGPGAEQRLCGSDTTAGPPGWSFHATSKPHDQQPRPPSLCMHRAALSSRPCMGEQLQSTRVHARRWEWPASQAGSVCCPRPRGAS
jgi:hypothetical protein